MSIVIITRNRREQLERTLPRHLASLPADGRASDVIVVDNGSDDGTAAWLAAATPVTALSLSENVGADGRLVGAAMAKTRYVAFSDDDSWWEPGSLDRACELLDDMPTVGLVAGSSYVGGSARADPLNRIMEGSPLRGPTDSVAVLGFLAFAAVGRREALLSSRVTRLGMGAEEQLIAIELASAGWALAYRPELRAYHEPKATGDRSGREVSMARNAMAIALSRRRGRGILRAIADVLTEAGLRTGMTALRRLRALWPWVLRHRRPVPLSVESDLRMVESNGPA